MECPNCKKAMIKGVMLDCRTGQARQHVCTGCRARFWEQLTDLVGFNFCRSSENFKRRQMGMAVS